MESKHSLHPASAALSQGLCVSFKMLRLTMDNPFGDGLSSIYRKTSDKPIFVFGIPDKEDDGEPCKILADVQTVRAGMDNTTAPEAIKAGTLQCLGFVSREGGRQMRFVHQIVRQPNDIRCAGVQASEQIVEGRDRSPEAVVGEHQECRLLNVLSMQF